MSAGSGGNSEPKQGQRSQSARGFCPRSTMRVPQPDIIEHFGNADAVPPLPEPVLQRRKAGIVRCCLSYLCNKMRRIHISWIRLILFILCIFIRFNAVIAACSEYTWLTKHKRVDGTMYSCTSLGVKLGGGIGTAITGWLLAASAFDRALAVQPDSCINMLKIMYLIIPFVLDAIITFILSRMKVEEANEKLRTELNH